MKIHFSVENDGKDANGLSNSYKLKKADEAQNLSKSCVVEKGKYRKAEAAMSKKSKVSLIPGFNCHQCRKMWVLVKY